MGSVFSEFKTVEFGGTGATEALSYRYYDPAKVVLGKPLGEHLRFAVAYWHSLAMTGSDPFGASTIPGRGWMRRWSRWRRRG